MKCCTTLILLAIIVLVECEPPVPQNQYLPPTNRYLPPTQQQGPPPPPPQNTYQAPPPSNNYLPPKNQYGPPAQTTAIFPHSNGGAGGYGGGNNGGGYGNGGGDNYGDEGNYGPAKYEFQYDVQDYQSGQDFGHMESRDGDKTVGRYYVLLPDGRKQIVNYEADENGYRPTITYEDTGAGGANGGGGGYNSNAQDSGFGGYDSNAQSKYNGY